MSAKKRVSFKETTEYFNPKKAKLNQNSDDQDDNVDLDNKYSGYNNSDDDGSDDENKIKASVKHSLDSDEEDNTDKYEMLNRNALKDIGQERKTMEFDNDIKITAFNMKEELEEGDFDTDGYYHWKKNKDESDAFLDNINWENPNSYSKKFKPQESLLDAAVKSGAIKSEDIGGEEISKSGDEESSSDESDDNEKKFSFETLNKNEQTELFRKIINFLRPGETILKAIKRLGNTGAAKTANLSASQRWLKKKQPQASDNKPQTFESKGDTVALENLTSLANKFIDMGFYDIYEETYEKLNFKINQSSLTKKNEVDAFDIFAEQVDESELSKAKSSGTSEITQSLVEDTKVKWMYKITNTEDAPLLGPFTSEKMLEMSLNGTFKETGVWCRKTDELISSNFYNSKRVDFELYT